MTSNSTPASWPDFTSTGPSDWTDPKAAAIGRWSAQAAEQTSLASVAGESKGWTVVMTVHINCVGTSILSTGSGDAQLSLNDHISLQRCVSDECDVCPSGYEYSKMQPATEFEGPLADLLALEFGQDSEELIREEAVLREQRIQKVRELKWAEYSTGEMAEKWPTIVPATPKAQKVEGSETVAPCKPKRRGNAKGGRWSKLDLG